MIIALAQSKGGSGKTTIAQAILGSVADRGHSVGAIDADFNSTLYNWIQNFSKHPIEGHAELDETKIVPLAGELEERHDLLVIDTAGAATQATVFAIGCADMVIIPIQLSSSDIIEAIKTNNLVKSASEMTKRHIEARVLLTDYQPNTNIAAHAVGELRKYELPLLDSRLNRLVAFKEMTFTGIVPMTGTAGAQVSALLDELKVIGVLPFLFNVSYDPRNLGSYEIGERASG